MNKHVNEKKVSFNFSVSVIFYKHVSVLIGSSQYSVVTIIGEEDTFNIISL